MVGATLAGMEPDFRGYRRPPDGSDAARSWWDSSADSYLAEHGEFLGGADFCWSPEGLRESEVRLLGEVAGRQVLEVGCGAAQCSRWLKAQGARAVGLDLSGAMLRAALRLDAQHGTATALVQADARRLPFGAASFDLAFTAFGALPFVAETALVHREVARVLRPGGTWTFAVGHPVRWAFPDDPQALTATRSYFDRRPYVETDDAGQLTYAEYHHTLGDVVTELAGAGLRLERLVEPEWPPGHERVWGGWGPVRGRLLPGTAIFQARRP